MISTMLRLAGLLGGLIFPLTSLAAQSVLDLSLREVLDVTMQRSAELAPRDLAPQYTSSSWLAALPTVGLSYLQSDEKLGTDEAEFTINLPIKSGRQREVDRELQSLSAEIAAADEQRRRLYWSGLIRESVWSHQAAVTRQRAAAHKVSLLSAMEARQRELLAASATSSYALLLIRQERLRAEIAQLEHSHDAQRWLQQYRQVTGLGNLPREIREPVPEGAAAALAQHPELLRLELGWRQQRTLLASAGQKASPWNLSLHAKQLDNPALDEQQLGVAIEMPLTLFDIETAPLNSEWQEQARQYWTARDELTVEIRRRWEVLNNEAAMLREKDALLRQSSELGESMAKQSEQLRTLNELGEEIALRRRMDAIDIESAAALNRVLIDQNNAMLRQAAGIPL
jgi:hypothetical protein